MSSIVKYKVCLVGYDKEGSASKYFVREMNRGLADLKDFQFPCLLSLCVTIRAPEK